MPTRYVILIAVLCAFVTPAPAAERPNIVLIMADDLGYSELGSYGQKLIQTPHLDRLASQGMRFTRNYAGNAVCAPSRCVLMTGKHPGHAWVRNNSEVKPEGQRPIPESEVTIAEILQSAGYATGAFGKWGLGNPGSVGDPNNQGFDRFFGYNCQRHAHSYYPSYLWSDDKRIELNNNPPVPGHASLADGADPADPASYDVFKGQDYAPDRINEQALAFIRENREQPFFLYYPTVIPHVALHVPDEELKPYLAKKWEDPPFTRSGGYGYTPHFTPRAAYASMITRMDRYVGRILDLLKELELEENTIVVFTSDNGTTHLKQEVDYDFFQSVKPLRGLKGSLYEGGIRVPLVVRWPGKVEAGSTNSFMTGLEDWLPTLLAMSGLEEKTPD
ncbi:MAG: arylsulfatase, partial [Pirellulaceae bacterium]|nr:arylsulfatase [Pirellulaceae bacterium]